MFFKLRKDLQTLRKSSLMTLPTGRRPAGLKEIPITGLT